MLSKLSTAGEGEEERPSSQTQLSTTFSSEVTGSVEPQVIYRKFIAIFSCVQILGESLRNDFIMVVWRLF